MNHVIREPPRRELSKAHSAGDRKPLIEKVLLLLVDLTSASGNRIVAWLAHLDALQPVGPVRIRLG